MDFIWIDIGFFKISRNELARLAMGTIFYIYNICLSVYLKEAHTKSTYVKMRGRNYVAQTRAWLWAVKTNL